MTFVRGIQYNDDGTALVPLTMPFVCTFGPIEAAPGADVSNVRSGHYFGLVMAGRHSATRRRRCGVCDRLVRGSSMRRHAYTHDPERGR